MNLLSMEVCSWHNLLERSARTDVRAAQVYYATALGIDPNKPMYGLLNSAPYLCCTLSCLLTHHMNKYLGRRGVILVTCLISFASCFGQAFVQSWQELFVARLILGLGIGPKSATVPIYTSECVPAGVRGALVMTWQVSTLFPVCKAKQSDQAP